IPWTYQPFQGQSSDPCSSTVSTNQNLGRGNNNQNRSQRHCRKGIGIRNVEETRIVVRLQSHEGLEETQRHAWFRG
ncbi:unnamed protein product, partial [Brassica rapa subsp. narinosa]